MKRRLAAIAAALLLSAGWYTYRLVWGLPLNINHFADRSSIQLLVRFPELLSSLGAVDNTVLDFHSHRLSDFSPAGERERVELMRRIVSQLGEYDRESLAGQQALTLDYLEWAWGARLAPYDYPWHFTNVEYSGPYPVNQVSGAQEIPLTVLSQFQQVVDARSAERYLERLAAVPAFLDHLGEAVIARSEMGVLPPRIIMDRLVTRAEHLLAQPVAAWSVYQAFDQKLSPLDLSAEARSALLDRARGLVEAEVKPAYGKYLALLRRLYPAAPEQVGIWALPGGEAYYRTLLSLYTSSALPPARIHELGLTRVEALGRELATALADLGYETGGMAERLARLSRDSSDAWPAGPGRKAALQSAYRQLSDELMAGTAAAFRGFDIRPIEVRAVPAEEELGAPAAYYRPPALDGSRPGFFYVNLGEHMPHAPFSMRTLVAHEAIPGHHLMASAMQDIDGIPMTRRVDYLAAYSEGWALYAERLAFELGLHDPLSDIGRLQAEMFRAVRLVVDTGIHQRRWTREQAIDYMMAQTGMARAEVVTEIERYIVMPGQACAYMVGMLEILSMREDARERLGARFTLPDFHAAVLRNGPLPLGVLEQEVARSLR